MRRSIGTPLTLFGLLLAVAMVCATSAQAPNPNEPTVDPSAPAALAAGGDASTPAPSAAPSDPSAAPATVDPSAPVSSRPRFIVGPTGGAAGPFVLDPSFNRSGRSRPVVASGTSGGRAPLPVVGRYQAVSHNGKLIVIDTATGECYEHNGSVWDSFAPPIDPNAVGANVRTQPSSAPN